MKKNKIILHTVVGVTMLFTFIGLSLITSGGVVYAVSDSTCAPGTICNPLGSTNTLNQVLNIIISTVQVIAGIISVVFIILAGLKFILAGGDPAKIKKARDMLLYVVIGIAIIFGAQAISIVVQTTIEQVGSGQQ